MELVGPPHLLISQELQSTSPAAGQFRTNGLLVVQVCFDSHVLVATSCTCLFLVQHLVSNVSHVTGLSDIFLSEQRFFYITTTHEVWQQIQIVFFAKNRRNPQRHLISFTQDKLKEQI